MDKCWLLPLLTAEYEPCTFDVTRDGADRPNVHDWLDVFRKSIPSFVKHALADCSIQPPAHRTAQAEGFRRDFEAVLDALGADPGAAVAGHPEAQPLTCMSLCAAREASLSKFGFVDVFKAVKDSENAHALTLLPGLLHELDGVRDTRSRLELAIRGVFAGNLFDLGAAASASLFEVCGSPFCATRAALVPRPWALDDLDAVLDALGGTEAERTTTRPVADGVPPNGRVAVPGDSVHANLCVVAADGSNDDGLPDGGAASAADPRAAAVVEAGGGGLSAPSGCDGGVSATPCSGGRDVETHGGRDAATPPYQHALLFVDNAGSDVVLGMLPFARELLKLGTKVTLAANSGPTINDITAAELHPLVVSAAEVDALLAAAWSSGRLQVVESGNHLPVIDLRKVSRQVVDLCSGDGAVDLIVLEGMGRAIETNLRARFVCDSLKLGMIKHPEVAACLGGRLYDCVCSFHRAASS